MRRSNAVLALLALAACSPTVDFHAQRVCSTIPQQTFPGVQASPDPGAPATLPAQIVAFDFGSGLPDLHARGVKDVKVLLRELTLAAASGGTAGPPTEFIRTLTVELQPPAGSTLPVEPILAYTRPAGTAPTTLVIAGDGTNLADYLAAGQLKATLQGTGDPDQLPTSSWTADATFCAEVSFTVDYLDAL